MLLLSIKFLINFIAALYCRRESWAPKNWCFWTVVLEKTLESPLDCDEIQPAHPKGGQFWVFIGRTDVEAEAPVLWPPDGKSWLIWKDSETGNDWGQEKKGTSEDGWDGWMASPTQWTWVWVDSKSWWWTGKPGVLRFMGLQRVGHSWAAELNWRLLRVPWTARRSNQSIIKEINPEYSLEELMLKLKL